MPLFGYGGPQYGLRDCKIAVWNGDGTYGDLVDVPSIQLYRPQLNMVNATLEGDDRETANASRVVSGQITMRWGSINLDVLNVILGSATYESGAGSSAYKFNKINNKDTPYFGINGIALAAEGGGSTQVFVPKCKLMEGFSIEFQYNTFAIPEITVKAIGDEYFPDEDGDFTIILPVEYADVQAVELPPVYFS